MKLISQRYLCARFERLYSCLLSKEFSSLSARDDLFSRLISFRKGKVFERLHSWLLTKEISSLSARDDLFSRLVSFRKGEV